MTPRPVLSVLLAAMLATGVPACRSGGSGAPDRATTTTRVLAAPEGLPGFYAVPLPVPRRPGVLIKREEVGVEGLRGRVYRVMYSSRSERGAPVVVTGLVAVPAEPPAGGAPVVSWAHGTNGMADRCAPSLDPAGAIPTAIANGFLERGWVVTATDYQGEGTPGLHPYIAGRAAAHDAIDIVRAARALPGVSLSGAYVVWGHSQGGHTAMHALMLGPTYAPDLDLVGVVAGAPPSQFEFIYRYLKDSPFKHYLLMAAGGLHAAYGREAPLGDVLTPYGRSLLGVLEQGCAADVAARMAGVDVDRVVKADPFQVPRWKRVLLRSDPQGFRRSSPVPLLIIHGGDDEQIPVASSGLLADHLCRLGQDLTRWVYPGRNHAGVIVPAAEDMTRWIEHRFQGAPGPDPDVPRAQPDVGVTRCPATPDGGVSG